VSWSFCIVTGGNSPSIERQIVSIQELNIPKYEIIVCGDQYKELYNQDYIRHIPIDETEKIPSKDRLAAASYMQSSNDPNLRKAGDLVKSKVDSVAGWITRKKNLCCKSAKYSKLCITHDYVEFLPGWYEGFEKFGDSWNVCMNKISNFDGSRFRDWTYWPPEHAKYDSKDTEKMYVSGTYFCTKKGFFSENPLDERLRWGEGEDVEWSLRVRDFWDYKMNVNSAVKFLKNK